MKGLERLREIAEGTRYDVSLFEITNTLYDGKHGLSLDNQGPMLKVILGDIVEQIASELERESVELFNSRVVDEANTCKALGLDPGDNPLTALGRAIEDRDETIGCLYMKLDEERDPAEDAIMSAYDLLPKGDRDAIAWVREHGGLDSVKELLGWVVGHCSTEQQLDFDFWLSGRVMHELGFDEDMADRDEVERRLLARLMPEGMEWLIEAWPRFEDDSPVHFGDTALIDGEADMVEAVQLWIHGRPVIYGDGGSQQLDKGERVKRPEPKVFDADGMPVKDADTVWLTDGRGPWKVSRIVCADRWRVICDDDENGHLNAYPEQLTHERPVADTWERLEEDAGKNPFDYCKDVGHRLDTCENSEAYKARDLVRRAKALAGRDA